MNDNLRSTAVTAERFGNDARIEPRVAEATLPAGSDPSHPSFETPPAEPGAF